MKINLKVFLYDWQNGKMRSKEIWDIIREYPDHDFFIDLYRHLLNDEELDDKVASQLYCDISYSYYISKKYFEEH